LKKLKVFISSVQKEFAEERQNLFVYLHGDPLLGLFFEPFLFENLPASDQRVDALYVNEVTACDIYIGVLGVEYGWEDKDGISPTEREFDVATQLHKTRLIFIKGASSVQRHPKMTGLIKKVGTDLVRKHFNTGAELNSGVYASLVSYLKEKEIIRTGPFDAALNDQVSHADLDTDKIKEFVQIARAKRGFPLPAESSPEVILTHLNLLVNGRISNAAILLFGRQPQRFFISSEIKCAHFHGYEIVKPVPVYQVYKGDVFQLVNQAVDFVLSKVDVSVGTREESVQAPVEYELPPAAVAEAIVNAVAHRDYTSNGSIQVMLFKDRLEIWNPGQLPFGLTTEKLRHPHNSIPGNPLLAEPMYLAGFIERLGTGTGDMIRLCREKGLREPDFIQEEIFKTVIWRTARQATGEVTGQATGQATGQVTVEVTGQTNGEVNDFIKRVVMVMYGELRRSDIMDSLELKHRDSFMDNYIKPSLEAGFIEMTFPDNPNHPNQRYRLTEKGEMLKKLFKNRTSKK
jgi:hypothetical protein